MIQSFANEEMTRLAFRAIDENILDYMDSEDSVLNAINYLKENDGTTQFSEGIRKYAAQKGCTNEKKLLQFLKENCYKENHVSPIPSDPTLRAWINGRKSPNAGEYEHRLNVYRLCFALGLDVTDTAKFFLKYYLDRPFNYKDTREATYYFCLRNHFDYQTAEKIVAEIKEQIQVTTDSPFTLQIGDEISSITTVNDFIDFMKSGYTADSYNKTARVRIEELIENCKEALSRFSKVNDAAFEIEAKNKDVISGPSKISDEYLILSIYGIGRDDGNTFSKSSMPERISKSILFPTQLNMIRKGTASSLIIRKALMLLEFYSFFIDLQANGNSSDELTRENIFEEFVQQLDGLLGECGYLQHYWRNPFDWMIGFAAKTENPIFTFHEIIEGYLEQS